MNKTNLNPKKIYANYKEFDLEPRHSLQVSKLALNLIKELEKFYKFTQEEKFILETAALLHDLGTSKSFSKHHKHSYKIIMKNVAKIQNKEYLFLIACVARYHRKSDPKLKHKCFADLKTQEKTLVEKLAAILRLADGLDRSHNEVVKQIKIHLRNEEFILQIYVQAPFELEKFGLEKKKLLFEKVWGKKLLGEFILIK